MEPLFGLLNLNKPAGMTSRRAVDAVQRLVRPAKCGHAGTLDPLASGVLVVGIGAATRLMDFVQRMPKTYLATFLLGRASDSHDIESAVRELPHAPVPSHADLVEACRAFLGETEQLPPAYSAVKVGGRRAYDLARAGRKFELKPRRISILQLSVRDYSYPEVQFEIECSSGTYVRALGRDIGSSLGTAAVMTALTRTSIGEFRIARATDPGALTHDSLAATLLSPLRALDSLPQIPIDFPDLERLRHGLPVAIKSGMRIDEFPGAELAAINPDGRLVALLRRRGDELAPYRTFFT